MSIATNLVGKKGIYITINQDEYKCEIVAVASTGTITINQDEYKCEIVAVASTGTNEERFVLLVVSEDGNLYEAFPSEVRLCPSAPTGASGFELNVLQYAAGSKVNAIKYVRVEKGVSLKQARDIVDDILFRYGRP